MRHRNHTSKLNRTSEHRLALMRNLSLSLIERDRIKTTAAKARQLRPFLEPLITLARKGDLASRKLVISRLQLKRVVDAETGRDCGPRRKLFGDIVKRVTGRPGGYLRIVKVGPRMGDGAPMAYIEFVDPAPRTEQDQAPAKAKTKKQIMHQRRKEMKKTRVAAG
jgi:large subunit ribosomal protein L17